MSLFAQWNVKARSHKCHATQRSFEEGEAFHTALFHTKGSEEWERRDYCEEAWQEPGAAIGAFSHWRSIYQKPEPGEKTPEPLEKGGAESLLRRLMEENHPATEAARYILALMLERRKILRQTDTKQLEETTFLIYEHGKTGEIFPVADPGLRLDALEQVQEEVASLLALQAAPSIHAGGNESETEPAPNAPAPPICLGNLE